MSEIEAVYAPRHFEDEPRFQFDNPWGVRDTQPKALITTRGGESGRNIQHLTFLNQNVRAAEQFMCGSLNSSFRHCVGRLIFSNAKCRFTISKYFNPSALKLENDPVFNTGWYNNNNIVETTTLKDKINLFSRYLKQHLYVYITLCHCKKSSSSLLLCAVNRLWYF